MTELAVTNLRSTHSLSKSVTTDFYQSHLRAAVFPLLAGFAFFGWRSLAVTALVVSAALLMRRVLQRVFRSSPRLHMEHCIWLALLMAMMLPPHLMGPSPFHHGDWLLAVIAGLMVVAIWWGLLRLGAKRIHPVIATFLIIAAFESPLLVPHWVLDARHAFVGNLFDAQDIAPDVAQTQPWMGNINGPASAHDALHETDPPSALLSWFTSGREVPDRASVSLQMLIRDQMPPLEDLIVGGAPASIGQGSDVVIIVAGLYLMYRGLIDYRIPLLAIVGAVIGLLVLPVPIIVTQTAIDWRWLALRPQLLGWPMGVTFINYELMASPLLFIAFFIATAPDLRPASAMARIIYALVFGLLCAPAQLYGSVLYGPLAALLVASLFTTLLDRLCMTCARWRRHAAPQTVKAG